ncbi:MAG: tetratricopeptide repeat protein [Acidobacteriota bacterium]|jgi:tetratricopeptide (TPR) repeat protein
MGKPMLVIVSVLVLAVAAIFFLPLRTQKDRTISSDAAKTSDGDIARDPSQANLPASNEGGPGAAERGTGVSRSKAKLAAQSSLEDIACLRRMLAEAQPEVRNLFENGIALMKSGHYPEARSVFQSLILSYPGSALDAPAHFGMGVASFLGGDSEQAAGQFGDFVTSFSSDAGLEDFAQAAQIDLAVTEIQLMRSAASEKDRRVAALAVAKALIPYVLRWPNSPQTPAARAALDEATSYIMKPH